MSDDQDNPLTHRIAVGDVWLYAEQAEELERLTKEFTTNPADQLKIFIWDALNKSIRRRAEGKPATRVP